jgi:chemotaxis response regulator CheB
METRTAEIARPFDVVVLAASAGGIEAISTIIKDLPQDFAASVLVRRSVGSTCNRMEPARSRRSPPPRIRSTPRSKPSPSRTERARPR